MPGMNTESANTESASADKYRVVALRYRPADFDDLIGQSQVATAIGNAIQQNRVGHAYLFTGARGVGKTSSARIFAKCLNCQEGPTIKPCGQCDICQSVSTGEDVDVLEIDGASNRGIDEIRQLRANANVRPSRARYKIYIIDEVHMLTMAAFNALLKTLEEPPEHVKFIFCTTDPEKIPITVLSRCQRFDFPPIKTQAIIQRLRHIVDQESIGADDNALELLARRAGGSMRDSQSLLEQLLSYTDDHISVDAVHSLLGTADNDAVFDIAEAIVANDSAAALSFIHRSVEAGVDGGQLTSQLLGLFRDAMAKLVGCGEELMLSCSTDDFARLQTLADSLGVEKVLSILRIFDDTLVKVRHSTSVRTMLETAAVRCCHLQNIDLVPQLIQQLLDGGAGKIVAGTPSAKKKQLNGNPDTAVTPTARVIPDTPVRSAASETTSETKGQTSTAVAKPVAQIEPSEPSDGIANDVNRPVPNPPATASMPVATQNKSSEANDSHSPVTSPMVSESSTVPEAPADAAAGPPEQSTVPMNLNSVNLESTWTNLLAEFNDLTAESAGNFEKLNLQEDCLQVTLKSELDQQMCDRPSAKQRLQDALQRLTGRAIRIDFVVTTDLAKTERKPAPVSRRQRIRDMEQNEFVKTAMDMFDGEITNVKGPNRKP